MSQYKTKLGIYILGENYYCCPENHICVRRIIRVWSYDNNNYGYGEYEDSV